MKEEFLSRMKSLLKDEYPLYLDSISEPNIRAIRVPNQKMQGNNFLSHTEFNLEKIPYIEDGYYLLGNEKIGNTIYHHGGAFYSQDPSAMIPGSILPIQENDKILDLCAAPGGKTLQLLERNPSGLVVSNEIDYSRCKILYSNIERFGYKNSLITNSDAKSLSEIFPNYFDKMIIDAPCSGEGMFRKYEDASNQWSLGEIELCHNRDKEILTYANKMLKENGYLVYSTCTFSKEENEDIIEWLCDTYQYETICLDGKIHCNLRKGFYPNTYRFYPFLEKGEGQFICLLQKKSANTLQKKVSKKEKINIDKEFINFFQSQGIETPNYLYKKGDTYYASPVECSMNSKIFFSYGIKLGDIVKGRFEPDHAFFKAYGNSVIHILDVSKDDAIKYLHGETILDTTGMKGYGVVRYDSYILGGIKTTNGIAKNLYPKGLRTMK